MLHRRETGRDFPLTRDLILAILLIIIKIMTITMMMIIIIIIIVTVIVIVIIIIVKALRSCSTRGTKKKEQVNSAAV